MRTIINGFLLDVKGQVQGIGFRPFVFRLATSLGLYGSVKNTSASVEIKLYTDQPTVEEFSQLLIQQCPSPGFIETIKRKPYLYAKRPNCFAILPSLSEGTGLSFPPDLAICQACIQELTNPTDRRYNYPFINCTQCGPRYTLINEVPYDRMHTSMAAFTLCADCQTEYTNPASRRFHAEPICCPQCGPSIWFQYNTDSFQQNTEQLENHTAYCTTLDTLKICVKQLSLGNIIAIKGIGGFHLACDATNEQAIHLLRKRKQRPSKPLAIMLKDHQHLQAYFSSSSDILAQAQKQLISTAAPIVLIPKKILKQSLPDILAPGQHHQGVMLAYSPLHWLLLNLFQKPLVMTSGNVSGEPICITNEHALRELQPFVDGWLLHNRNIIHRCDDSVVNVINKTSHIIRRARGYVPNSWPLPEQLEQSLLEEKYLFALGADLKNCFSMTVGQHILLSSHHGDFADLACLQAMQQDRKDYQRLLNLPDKKIQAVVIDSHPDYHTSRYGKHLAEKYQVPIISVQHHHAHFASCLLENQLSPDQTVLGIIFDGLGYGNDHTFWGGEFLLGNYASFQRVAYLKPFPLLGGEKANKQPWRNLIALLAQSDCLHHLKANLPIQYIVNEEIELLLKLSSRFPLSSSIGRLFDAVAALLNIAPYEQTFEGEAAMQLEALALQYTDSADHYELFSIIPQHKHLLLDSSPLWHFLIEQLRNNKNKARLAYIFHLSLVDTIIKTVITLKKQEKDFNAIALSGGVFQNTLLLSTLKNKLESEGFTVYTQHQIPCNDGGIALGQIAVASTQIQSKI
ncbi:carbamoyltransferase HypF [Zooshikella harenae]|uniref:Carbamoyltransferase HypF n=1 Tax=Zooshikella harenae TaxID=2827238 RepID=A0ABS5ZGB4_9GAMM|nr:carbamoyltransferase HypF [Zooshikella harenae]MBU2712321.1 carbamoyltransferase HypF [Zooshikella harenae]